MFSLPAGFPAGGASRKIPAKYQFSSCFSTPSVSRISLRISTVPSGMMMYGPSFSGKLVRRCSATSVPSGQGTGDFAMVHFSAAMMPFHPAPTTSSITAATTKCLLSRTHPFSLPRRNPGAARAGLPDEGGADAFSPVSLIRRPPHRRGADLRPDAQQRCSAEPTTAPTAKQTPGSASASR